MKLGSLFSDGAVFQRDKMLTLWGETEPALMIKAEIAGRQAFARASADGEFTLHLPPLPAGGPYELKVFSPDNDREKIIVRDILIGEVWLCSGQSNMYYPPGPVGTGDSSGEGSPSVREQQSKELFESIPDGGKFRFIRLPSTATGCREKYFNACWKVVAPENASEVSAVGAWFGSELRKGLDHVPVGLICCSWGGSIVEAWTSPASLYTNPDTAPMIENWEKIRQQKETWNGPESSEALFRRHAKPDSGNVGFGRGWAESGFDDSQWGIMRVPGSWIAQKISGNGAIWVRRKINLPPELAGKELVLHTGGIDKQDVAYFNGVEIGRTGQGLDTQYYNVPRSYKVPGHLVNAGENTIAIRAFSCIYDGSFNGAPDAYFLSGEGQKFPLAGSWKAQAESNFGFISPRRSPSIDNQHMPGLLFDGMIAPLLPFAIRGVIWYQGENNADFMEDAKTYQHKLETLIRDWRFHWKDPELPFFPVQLADFRFPADYDEDSVWAVLRDAQRRAGESLAGVHLVTALGTGEENDIHPQDKKSVGKRLAASALHHVYRHDILPGGPLFRELKREAGALRVFFRFADGLELRGEPGRSFYLAGADGRYFPADQAEISGDSILLASRQVKHPVSVRYAWSDNPNNILYNQQYPAAAFSSETP